MIAKHRGFVVTGMIGGMSAEINDDGQYTEIMLIGPGEKRSFDLGGLESFIGELGYVKALAGQVENNNEMAREQEE